MLVIAGCNHRDCCVEIIDDGALQVLWLKSFTCPAAGCCTVEAECAADSIISAGTSEECIDLLDRRLCPTKTELKNSLHRRRELMLSLDLPFNCTFVQFL